MYVHVILQALATRESKKSYSNHVRIGTKQTRRKREDGLLCQIVRLSDYIFCFFRSRRDTVFERYRMIEFYRLP